MSKSRTKSSEPSFGVGLGWALAALLKDYQSQVEAALEGLPGGARAFLVMSHVDKKACQSQISIAEHLDLDKTTLTYLLDALEKEGLVRRTTDPNDRRSRHITLTTTGSSALARFTKAVGEIEHNILGRLGGEDAAQFHQSLMKLTGLEGKTMGDVIESDQAAHICQSTMGITADS